MHTLDYPVAVYQKTNLEQGKEGGEGDVNSSVEEEGEKATLLNAGNFHSC